MPKQARLILLSMWGAKIFFSSGQIHARVGEQCGADAR
jgi:hypothetical protein